MTKKNTSPTIHKNSGSKNSQQKRQYGKPGKIEKKKTSPTIHEKSGNNNSQQKRQYGKRGKTKRRSKSTASSALSERFVRDTTSKILQLGEAAKNSAMNQDTDSDENNTTTTSLHKLQMVVGDPSFWTQATQAIDWWAIKGTTESVDLSFRMLDALADLASIAQNPNLSSALLSAQNLNQLVQNWVVAWAMNGNQNNKDKDVLMSPVAMFQKLEIYRRDSQNTTRTRRKLRPDLETYQCLMEAASIRTVADVPPNFNETLIRHLMETNDVSIRPDLKAVTQILHGWSTRGHVIALEELKRVLELVEEQILLDEQENTVSTATTASVDEPKKRTPVEIFNAALFAFSRDNSNSKDSRGAEKMLSIVNFMEMMAVEYSSQGDIDNSSNHLDLYPNVESYNLVLNAFARAGKGAQAEMVLRTMVDRYVHAHSEAATALDVDASSSSSNVIKNAKPITKSFTIAITAFARSEENYAPEKAEGILRWQQELNSNDGPLQGSLAPETITFNNVIRAWSWRRSDKAVQRCESLRKEMHKQNVTPDQQTYGQSFKAIALSNLKEKGRHAVQAWREMEIRGIQADNYTKRYFEKCVALSAQRESPPSDRGRRQQNWR